jgi:hypothetical protein
MTTTRECINNRGVDEQYLHSRLPAYALAHNTRFNPDGR